MEKNDELKTGKGEEMNRRMERRNQGWKQGIRGLGLSFAAFLALSFVGNGNGDQDKKSPSNSPKIVQKEATLVSKEMEIYKAIDFQGKPPLNPEVFQKAYWGHQHLRAEGGIPKGKENLLTVIDFSLHSAEPRLWVIDIMAKELIFCDYVAHGQNSGLDYARSFSNRPQSHQSSLGFYLTDNIYIGKHGKSLRLHGMEKGVNHLAYERAIVIHGADYVSESFIQGQRRLGRSWGCPAVSRELAPVLIDRIAGGSLLFIYAPDPRYLSQSSWIQPPNKDLVERTLLAEVHRKSPDSLNHRSHLGL